MKKRQVEKIQKAGFVPLGEFLQKNIVSRCGEGEKNDDAMEQLLHAIRSYDEASIRFHGPGGDGFLIVLRCLRKYLDYKFMRQNNQFRFTDTVPSYAAEPASAYEYVSVKKKKEPVLSGSRADIYYLLHEADQTSVATRRCEAYVTSRKLHLTAVLIRLIEQTVASMERHSSERLRTYARFLKTVYMCETCAELDAGELYRRLNLSKKQYYRIRSEAITFLSECLFGILAGENGMAELFIRDSDIVVLSEFR